MCAQVLCYKEQNFFSQNTSLLLSHYTLWIIAKGNILFLGEMEHKNIIYDIQNFDMKSIEIASLMYTESVVLVNN